MDTVQVFKRTDEALEENEDNEINDFLIEDIEVPGDHFSILTGYPSIIP